MGRLCNGYFTVDGDGVPIVFRHAQVRVLCVKWLLIAYCVRLTMELILKNPTKLF